MFLFLLGRCVDAEFGDKFMFNLWENCQTVFQGILHSSLSVWWFYFPTSLLTLDILFWFWRVYCVYEVGWCVSFLAPFFLWAHILPQSFTVLYHMPSLLPFTLGLSGNISEPLFSSKISCVQISLICICSSFSLSWSCFLLPLGGALRAHLTMNAKPNESVSWMKQ